MGKKSVGGLAAHALSDYRPSQVDLLASPQVPYSLNRNKKKQSNQALLFLVEVTGLEPTTFWSLTRRATKLRYTSVLVNSDTYYT